MAKRKWTPEQSCAINTRDKTLLVSAAAGSGKTATLTERIIRTLLDTESPTSISELLVVTFTNAAAQEMRGRITESLKAACAENPENKHLQRQLMLLPSAKIRTIDSFCSELLRQNVDKVGIAPNYRILDTAEGQLLAFSVLEGLINSIYNGEAREVAVPEEFEALADCLTSAKNMQGLSEVLFELYERISSETEPFSRLSEYREATNPECLSDKEKTPFIAFYIERLSELCDYAEKSIDKITGELSCGSDAERAYIDTFRADYELFEELSHMGDYRAICDALSSLKWQAVPRKRAGEELTELQVSVRERRDLYKDALKELRERAFSFSDYELEYCFRGLYSRLGTLISVLQRFDALFMAEKRKRASFGYNDIERFTYEALWQGGERTDTALSLREQFKCVYIDEYQDVNELQDKIFEAVSRENNRFMVGDIKQSIYGFRGAEPDIFAKMKKTLPKYGEDNSSPALGLFMSENFRCDEGIVDLVNGIFDRIFGVIGESIGYLPDDRLKYGKGAIQAAEVVRRIPTVTVVEKQKAEDTDDTYAAEPHAIAEEIKRLLDNGRLNDGTSIRPRDIAIIMRKTQSRAKEYEAELSSLGIPVHISGERSFFLNREVLLALCLLNSIDNPRRDIYLSGLMRSPLYDFSADELLRIASERCGSMYDSLVRYTEENPDFKRGKDFLRELKGYRRIAESASTSALIYRLYRETGLFALSAKNGVKDNLTLLYNYAREFEAKEYKGLYAFISFINELIANKTQFDTKTGASDADEVNIITTHSSKGLEYPVVFFAESASSLYPSAGGGASNIRLAKGFGVSFPLRTEGGVARVMGITDFAIADYLKEKTFEEEMRVLYVALTRARERLYIYGKAKEPKEYISKMREYGELLTPYSVKRLSSALDVICAAHPAAKYEVYENASGKDDLGAEPKDISDSTADAASPTMDAQYLTGTQNEVSAAVKNEMSDAPASLERGTGADLENVPPDITESEFLQRFKYKYPYEHLTTLPEKMSVSRLSPTVLDGAELPDISELMEAFCGEAALENENKQNVEEELCERKRTYPAFYTGKAADESAKRGIATHLFMQFCDLEALRDAGASAELDRLCSRGFISPADKGRVRLAEIEKFRKSELFSDMLSAVKIYRELRFNVRMPAELFTENEERKSLISDRKILVQGVIDCIIENGRGELLLVDYKTDRLTKEEMSDTALAARTLTEKHKTQLAYYAYAVNSIFSKEPKRVLIYSLPLGKCIEIK